MTRSRPHFTIILFGLSMAVLLTGLKLMEYRFFAKDFSLEILLGIVALLFVSLGVWAGRRLAGPAPGTNLPFIPNRREVERLHISPREMEVLDLMSRGLSNKEIADTLFISLSTVKTHTANLFQKLDAVRRTQALKKARDLGLIS
ncbi:MAG: hypothetical protein HBSIN02_02060 [Bacteroidia bacterium]|nr:MAG: hypothetical protein HBSIN02_02060 [Bacteroidia bacterium]